MKGARRGDGGDDMGHDDAGDEEAWMKEPGVVNKDETCRLAPCIYASAYLPKVGKSRSKPSPSPLPRLHHLSFPFLTQHLSLPCIPSIPATPSSSYDRLPTSPSAFTPPTNPLLLHPPGLLNPVGAFFSS
ncbi:Hypothetical protein D9617_47g010710 [Elsinoe fawcettii]|nr:Hypothetical protein D9617_47g010710 [Elsinoe fawcettii]